MTEKQILKKIFLIDREIKYYKRVYSGHTEKLFELLNKRKQYSRRIKSN